MASARTPGQNRRSGDPVVVPMRRGGISQARRYRPRGRTVREAAADRRSDPYGPALQLVSEDGGASAPGTRTAGKSGSRTPSGNGSPRRRAAPGRSRGGATGSRRAVGSRGRPASGRGTSSRSRVGRRRRRSRLGNPMRRLRFGTVMVLILFMVIAGRLVELQLTDASAYATEGLQQRLREMPLPAPRGSILDRSGARLAYSDEARYVYADPELVNNREKTAAALSPVLGIPRSELAEKMRESKYDDGRAVRFVYLARAVSVKVGDRVSKLKLMGIGVDRDEKREYPGDDLAANVMGFTGEDGGGLAGIEARYDDRLAGEDGKRVVEIGKNGVPIPSGVNDYTQERAGHDLRLTLDRYLQYPTQRALARKLEQVGASFGSAIVIDSRTGEVLAMASWPSYNAADPFDVPKERRVDHNTATVLEPGSSHKPLLIGAALEENVVDADSTPVVPPTIHKGGRTYQDTRWHTTREMTLDGILAHSSNVGTIQFADQLGADKVYEYQRRFGLGQRTGVGMPGEASGIVRPPDGWHGSDYGSIPIGLGVAVTPIQLAAAYVAIANDGVWLPPRLVDATVGPDGTMSRLPSGETRPVLSAETARDLRRGMEAVITAPGATGRKAAVRGYRVAGKTGTGMLARDNDYLQGDVSSFIGMAPADEPRFVVGVFAHVPSGGGGDVSSSIFSDIMADTLRRYAVPPTGRKAPRAKVSG